MRTKRTAQKSGFTLVELLVVIGIIAVLIGILLPALNRARKQANSVVCMANLRSLGQALVLYTNAHKGALPGNLTSAALLYGAGNVPRAGESWDNKLAPWLGIKMVQDPNPIGTMPPAMIVPPGTRSAVLTCPSDVRADYSNPIRSYSGIFAKDDSVPGSYTAGPYGDGRYVGTMIDGNLRMKTHIKITQIKKPVECVFLAEYWIEKSFQFVGGFTASDPPLGNTAGFIGDAASGAKYHNKKLNFLFVDGHAGVEDPRDFHKKKWFWRRYKD